MKKSFKAITAAAFFTALLSGNSFAQNLYVTNAAKTLVSNSAVDNTIKSSTPSNEVVAAKFSRLFPAAKAQQWTSSENTCLVSFDNNGRKSRASFTSNGLMNYVISDCTMEQLPAGFAQKIKKDYSGYKLYNAIEINAHESVAYQAVLENESTYLTLKYTNEGVEEIQKVKKND